METQNITFIKALKGGAIAGLIGAGLNNIWTLIANALGSTVPSLCQLRLALQVEHEGGRDPARGRQQPVVRLIRPDRADQLRR